MWNQDSCVVVAQSTSFTFSNMFFRGIMGCRLMLVEVGVLRIRVILCKLTIFHVFCSSDLVQAREREIHSDINPTFRDSIVPNLTNGLLIKTNYNSSDTVSNVAYSNIVLSNIKNCSIDIEQDYLNGGAFRIASNCVLLHNNIENIKGRVVPAATDYYVL